MLKIRQFIFNPVQENTYVIYNDENECWVVDPGCYYDYERKEISDFISELGLAPKCLLNTHCHLDHVFGNKFIHESYGLELYIHEKERPVFDNAPEAGLRWGLPFENYTGPVHYIRDGQSLSLGKHAFQVLFTPGHSPGSISFYSAEAKLVIDGDVLFRSGIGRTDLPGGDYQTLINSISRTLFALPDETKVYSGHGPETTIGYEKAHNPFMIQAAR